MSKWGRVVFTISGVLCAVSFATFLATFNFFSLVVAIVLFGVGALIVIGAER
jgi:hypothetical protein